MRVIHPTPPDPRPRDEWELDAQDPVVVENLGKVCLVNIEVA